MKANELTSQEAEIIQQLLLKKGIPEYTIVVPVGEGKSLPGSTYDYEIEEVSGTIVTARAVYGFWLSWTNGEYTLGEERGHWMEVDMSKMLDPDDILTAQQQLREKQE